jgi:hypothetical protein
MKKSGSSTTDVERLQPLQSSHRFEGAKLGSANLLICFQMEISTQKRLFTHLQNHSETVE